MVRNKKRKSVRAMEAMFLNEVLVHDKSVQPLCNIESPERPLSHVGDRDVGQMST